MAQPDLATVVQLIEDVAIGVFAVSLAVTLFYVGMSIYYYVRNIR